MVIGLMWFVGGAGVVIVAIVAWVVLSERRIP